MVEGAGRERRAQRRAGSGLPGAAALLLAASPVSGNRHSNNGNRHS